MSGTRRSDGKERLRQTMMRRAKTEAESKGIGIGGVPVKRSKTRAEPSMPKLPWEKESKDK